MAKGKGGKNAGAGKEVVVAGVKPEVVDLDAFEKQLDEAVSLVKKYLGKQRISKELKNSLSNAIKANPNFISSLKKKRSKAGIESVLFDAQVIDVQKTQQLTKAQREYNKEISKLSKMLNNKEFNNLADFYKIGEQIKTANFKGGIKGLDTSTGKTAYSDYLAQEDSFLNVGKNLKGIISKKELAQMQIPLVGAQLRSLREEIVLTSAKGGKITELTNELNRLAKVEKKLKGATGLSSFGKFLNRFKSYATIRLFRNLFSFIEKCFSESLQSMAKFDSGVNDSLSKINSSFSIMSSSLVAMLAPILETVAPIVQQIATALADVANGFSRASAQAKGLSTYTKVNADYMKDFSEETKSSLLSFDKFESLNSTEGNMFETGDVSESLGDNTAEFGAELYKTLQLVLDVIKQIWDIATPLIDDTIGVINPILEIANILLTVLGPTISSIIDLVESALVIVTGALDIIAGVLYLLTGDFDKAWEHIGSGFKKMAQGIINALIDVVNIFLNALNFLFIDSNPLFWVLKLLGVNTKNFRFKPFERIQLFANGGIAKQGDLFVANDAGPELVYSGPNNSSSIMNISQFKQAMVEAIYESADVFQNQNGDIVLKLDGAEIARSKSFGAEFFRQHPILIR